MRKAISNTSPLLLLHRIGCIDWLSQIFKEFWVPDAVIEEISEGRSKGYDVPNLKDYSWFQIHSPKNIPSMWLSTDLGRGELAAMALGLENQERIILLDDALARRIAHAAGLEVWGTLKILLEAKKQGITE